MCVGKMEILHEEMQLSSSTFLQLSVGSVLAGMYLELTESSMGGMGL